MNASSPIKRPRVTLQRVILLAAGLGLLAVVAAVWRGQLAPALPPNAYFQVKRGDLLISIVEEGALKAVNEASVRSEFEGMTRILSLVPEGAYVKKGELIAQLDDSELRTRVNTQELTYQENLFTYQQAVENLKIQKSVIESNLKEAELRVEFAQSDLDKYREGDAPKQRKNLESSIALVEEELRQAKTKFERTTELEKQSFATKSELEADSLRFTVKEIELSQAKEDLRLITKFDQPNTLRMLESNLKQAQDELDRLKQRSAGEISQAEADLNTSKSAVELTETRLNEQKKQLGKAKIYAPQDGLIAYATFNPFRGDGPRMEEGRGRMGGGGGGGPQFGGGGGGRGRRGMGGMGGGMGGMEGGSFGSSGQSGGQMSSTRSGGSTSSSLGSSSSSFSSGVTGSSFSSGGQGSSSGSGGSSSSFGSGGQRSGGSSGASFGSGGQGSSVGSSGQGSSGSSFGSGGQSFSSSSSRQGASSGTSGQGTSFSSGGQTGSSRSQSGSFGSGGGGGSYGSSGQSSFSGGSSSSFGSEGQFTFMMSSGVIEEGGMVLQRQEIFKLPDVSHMLADVKIHESRVRQVLPGMAAYVTVDCLPNRVFNARVRKVGFLPDSQSSWINPNVKLYATEVLIEDDLPILKPGISARAEIIITNIQKALSVPIQAVVTLAGQQVCYVAKGRTTVPVPVTVGLFNDQLIEIKTGLKDGDRVLLAPPAGSESTVLESANRNGETVATNRGLAAKASPAQPAGPEGRALENPRPREASAATVERAGRSPNEFGAGSRTNFTRRFQTGTNQDPADPEAQRRREEFMQLSPEEREVRMSERRGRRGQGQGQGRRRQNQDGAAPPEQP